MSCQVCEVMPVFHESPWTAWKFIRALEERRCWYPRTTTSAAVRRFSGSATRRSPSAKTWAGFLWLRLGSGFGRRGNGLVVVVTGTVVVDPGVVVEVDVTVVVVVVVGSSSSWWSMTTPQRTSREDSAGWRGADPRVERKRPHERNEPCSCSLAAPRTCLPVPIRRHRKGAMTRDPARIAATVVVRRGRLMNCIWASLLAVVLTSRQKSARSAI